MSETARPAWICSHSTKGAEVAIASPLGGLRYYNAAHVHGHTRDDDSFHLDRPSPFGTERQRRVASTGCGRQRLQLEGHPARDSRWSDDESATTGYQHAGP